MNQPIILEPLKLTPRTHVVDLVGPAVDAAIATAVPTGETVTWDLSITPIIDPHAGMVLQAWFSLVGPSANLGESLISVIAVDPRKLAQPDHALDIVRGLLNNLRQMRAQMLAQASPIIPGGAS